MFICATVLLFCKYFCYCIFLCMYIIVTTTYVNMYVSLLTVSFGYFFKQVNQNNGYKKLKLFTLLSCLRTEYILPRGDIKIIEMVQTIKFCLL